MSDEPMTPLIEAATQLHEWYISLQVGGFTKMEAMTIIAKCITESGAE